ncbi:MAG TPA: Bax inhibitor-1/YccA family protein [Aliidongia sp.]|uniref:Bax inhibitor-1/YccA family protein n=1 Tax=Aliidongia sp. TaxID=1914230 RepID=UPI002DDCE22B|nr:Bax inhibitor-1/YccA family protein [Aliidongia sp.]HEV2678359.1 Bax inhibitor-1/YccA family protein [Aliidongia sp.]
MSYGSQDPWSVGRSAAVGAEYDLGLRTFMLRVYNYMASGLVLTGITAWLAAETGFYAQIAHSPLIYVVMFAPFVLVMVLGFRIQKMSFGAAQATFWAYSALMGLSLAGIFLVFTHTSIALTFFITGATFLAMSLYGYTTKSDLTKMGSFMMMGLFGVVLASVVNMFMHSTGLQFVISIVGVIVFTGLTAWDTQRIKEQYDVVAGYDGQTVGKTAIMGALTLYLDFINLFMLLLQFFGQRRN